jgi:hypothetical protein
MSRIACGIGVSERTKRVPEVEQESELRSERKELSTRKQGKQALSPFECCGYILYRIETKIENKMRGCAC